MRALSLIATLLLAASAVAASAAAAPLKPIQLPKPQTEGGRPLMRVLKDRASARAFRGDKLPPQQLANLLWAAFGINRPDGRRTAPSAMNWQELDLYVALAEGTFRYDAKANTLLPVVAGDLRARTGKQPFVKDAALDLVYVADLTRTGKASAEDQLVYTAADAGFVAQNVYLFCASEGLATVVRGAVDRPALAKVLKLRPEQRIILAQTVGFPKK